MKTIEITLRNDLYSKPQAEIDNLISLGYPRELLPKEPTEREALIAEALPMNPIIDEASHSFTLEGETYRRVYIRNQAYRVTTERLESLIYRGVILGWQMVELNTSSVHALYRD